MMLAALAACRSSREPTFQSTSSCRHGASHLTDVEEEQTEEEIASTWAGGFQGRHAPVRRSRGAKAHSRRDAVRPEISIEALYRLGSQYDETSRETINGKAPQAQGAFPHRPCCASAHFTTQDQLPAGRGAWVELLRAYALSIGARTTITRCSGSAHAR